jgi:hypothetical protein
MKNLTTFVAGLVLGAAITASAAVVLHPWNHLDVEAANAIFHGRSGVHIGLVNPPEPDKQVLHVEISPSTAVNQTAAVMVNPPEPDFPPDPCFIATVNPPEPDHPTVAVTVLHADQIAFTDAAGDPLALCPAGVSTVGTSK